MNFGCAPETILPHVSFVTFRRFFTLFQYEDKISYFQALPIKIHILNPSLPFVFTSFAISAIEYHTNCKTASQDARVYGSIRLIVVKTMLNCDP